MLKTKRITVIFLYLLAITSSVMLSMSIGSNLLLAVALIGTTAGFLIADLWGKFRIDGWMANCVSIVILVLAMKDFLPSDSAGKLISVANLLVYLQTVLMFQDKTPRLNWQIMVLSLLQVVITSIFSLKFEGSGLLLVYFLLGGCTMALQSVYADSIDIQDANEDNAKRLQSHLGGGDSFLSQWETQRATQNQQDNRSAKAAWSPVAILDAPGFNGGLTTRLLLSLVSLFLVSVVFTLVLLFMAPRQDRPWFSPIVNSVPSKGIRKEIDNLDMKNRVTLMNNPIFRASVVDHKTGEPLRLSSPMYFRGLALSSLVIKDNKTTWKPPYERVESETYQYIPSLRSNGKRRLANIEVMMEETAESLLYGVMPIYRTERTSNSIEFCHEVSAMTRCRENVEISLRPYRYEFQTVITPRGSAARAWPYISNTRNYRRVPMSEDPGQQAYLTVVDLERYPKLVAIADELNRNVQQSNGSRMDLVRRIENHFCDSGIYEYNLDYRQVEWDPDLDPIEDFVANTRLGHCTIFASAMTIMLRSQGIPARLVTGFHGGSYNELTNEYVVRADHAHAWVEVYLRPEDCTEEMRSNGEAWTGGAWLIAEPTPGISADDDPLGATDAIELARNVWQDYMLGFDQEEARGDMSYAESILMIFESVVKSDIRTSVQEAADRMSPVAKATLTFCFGLLFLIPMVRFLIRKADYEEELPDDAVGRLKRFFADAIGLISPDLREWVIGPDKKTAFYSRFVDVMEEHELVRVPNQTHREFAQLAVANFESHPALSSIESTIFHVTNRFNDVRFGKETMGSEEKAEIDKRVDELARFLKQKK